jgi:hypothetical protein
MTPVDLDAWEQLSDRVEGKGDCAVEVIRRRVLGTSENDQC